MLFNCLSALSYLSAQMAGNVVAASRRRGFHKGSGGRQTSKSPQNCLRAYTPACVKPLVRRSACHRCVYLFLILSSKNCKSFLIKASKQFLTSFSVCSHMSVKYSLSISSITLKSFLRLTSFGRL